MYFVATIKIVAFNRKNMVRIPATKTEHAPNIKYVLISKMRLLSGVYGIAKTQGESHKYVFYTKCFKF